MYMYVSTTTMCPGNRWHLAVKKSHQDHSTVNDDDDVVGIIMANCEHALVITCNTQHAE